MNSIDKIYEYLDKVTPLDFDCGNICNSKCCQGDDKNGMILFPGEEDKFSEDSNFRIFYDNRYDCKIVSCNGNCDRKKRPVSCRIFPYLFYKTDKDNPCKVAADLRALDYCPVFDDQLPVSKKFLRAMRISAKLIDNDVELSEFVIKLSGLLTDTNGL